MKKTYLILLISVFFLFAGQASARTYHVTKTTDDNGLCLIGDCSLREAIKETNRTRTNDEIVFDVAVGTFENSITSGANDEDYGDLNITKTRGTLNIIGNGETNTIISGGEIDNVFEIESTSSLISFLFLTINNGYNITTGSGGGMFIREGNVMMNYVTVAENEVNADYVDDCGAGAGILNWGILTVNKSNITGNENTGDCGEGGGIENESSGTLVVTDTKITDNLSPYGAGISNYSGDVVISKSVFSGNEGGAIANYATMYLTNSTISQNNSTDYAGGIFVRSNSTYITNCTISNNTTETGDSAAIFSDEDDDWGTTYRVHIKNTIISDNTITSTDVEQNCNEYQDSWDYNIDDDGTCSLSRLNDQVVDPILSSDGLLNNGGYTETIALDSGSPAIDAIPLSSCRDFSRVRISTDQRGVGYIRPVNMRCDIGAYEVQ